MSDIDFGKVIAEIHQGNFGARNVCFKIFNNYSLTQSEEIFKKLKSSNLLGASLWIKFKEHKENLQDFVEAVDPKTI